VHPRDTAGWDRAADLEAIQATYDRYKRTERGRLWDRRAPGYARLVDDLQRRLVSALAASAPRDGGRVLDLGCGDGDLAAERGVLEAGTEWIGLDLRPEAIAAAAVRFPDARFIVGSADAVPLDDASVDVIVARVLFSSLPSERLEAAVAGEIGRLLRPGGWLVWLDIRYANPANRAVHGVPLSRIASLFPGWRRELRTAGLVPPLARRLGPTTPLTYPLLAAVPILRSHLVGRLSAPARAA
jgi:ubiquinone/menaquinone biosynthesis C-methylase UbiE